MAASKLPNDKKLIRFLYTNVNDNIYTTGDVETYSLKFTLDDSFFLNELLEKDLEKILEIILNASKDKQLPRYCIIFYLLAYAINSKSTPNTQKHLIHNLVLKLCRNDEDFFCFIKYCAKFRLNNKTKLTHSVLNLIQAFYSAKDSLTLATSFAQNHACCGWSHKDLIKLGHVKFDERNNVVVNHILFKKPIENDNFKPEQEIINKYHTLRTTKDEKIASDIVKQLNKVNLKYINPELFHSVKVWTELVKKMRLQELLEKLPKMFKLGLFKSTDFTKLTSDIISNAQTIKNSNIHPVEVFIHVKNFDKGGRAMDPKLANYLVTEKKVTDTELNKLKTRPEPKLPPIRTALQKCLKASYNNIQPTNKRYLITIDVSCKSDAPCLTNKNIECLEAALAYSMSISKIERDVTIAVFNDRDIKLINFERGAHYNVNLQKLREHKCEFLSLNSPIEWASKNKKHIDIFINFVNHIEFLGKIPKEVRPGVTKPTETLLNYRKKMNLQNTKLVTVCLGSSRLAVCNGEHQNVLAVNGLDLTVPSVIGAFCANKFV